MKFLIVSGDFDENGGKKSHLIQKIYENLSKNIENIQLINGGHLKDIEQIYNNSKEYDTILWMPHIDNELPKLRDVKLINPHCTLIMSKRNDGVYNFQQLINRCINQKANLMIEFSKQNEMFSLRLFDPLGNVWYDGTDVKAFTDAFTDRLLFIKSTHRLPTYASDKLKIDIKLSKKFLRYVNNWSLLFYSLIKPDDEVSRFLGNISFKLKINQAISKENNYMIVSERNADKVNITEKNFVVAYSQDDKIYYLGDKKPSRDTAIQYQLYKKYRRINYILHCHTYVDGGSKTRIPVPCGSIEEIDEIMSAEPNMNKSFYQINLVGHGCIIMAKNLKDFDRIKFVHRELPEIMFV